MAWQRKVGGKRVIELAKRIGSETDGGEKISKFLHLIGGKIHRSALQIGESAVEFLNAVTIATPMKGLVGDDVLKGECNHRTFHGMKVIGGGGQKIAEIEV